MILFKFLREEEKTPLVGLERIGRRAWYWTFEITNRYIGFIKKVEFLNEPKREDHHWIDYYMISLNKNFFKFGFEHAYYDGPHCMFWLGHIQFAWRYDSCKKCHEGMDF